MHATFVYVVTFVPRRRPNCTGAPHIIQHHTTHATPISWHFLTENVKHQAYLHRLFSKKHEPYILAVGIPNSPRGGGTSPVHYDPFCVHAWQVLPPQMQLSILHQTFGAACVNAASSKVLPSWVSACVLMQLQLAVYVKENTSLLRGVALFLVMLLIVSLLNS